MPIRKITLRAAPEDAGKRLDQFLAERLPEALRGPRAGGAPVALSKAKVRKLVVAGAVYLNRSRVRIASKTLIVGATVEAMVDLERLLADGAAQDRPFAMDAKRILYEDDFLIVVDKPPGLPTQPTLDEARDNLFAAVKKFLSTRDGVPQPYLALHHRLDRDTSGVVLFAKKTEANAGVADMFAKHTARKVYQALAERPLRGGSPRGEWVVENYLGKDPRSGGKRARFTAVRSGGDPARTEFRLLAEFARAIHVEARPITGRTHQIRVHLAEGGTPILGDTHYGASERPSERVPRIMLHAASLTFPHPVHNYQVSVESPLPEDFTRCLRSLQNPPAG